MEGALPMLYAGNVKKAARRETRAETFYDAF
jgi:hypothetical protein